jgi:hypothetical protein
LWTSSVLSSLISNIDSSLLSWTFQFNNKPVRSKLTGRLY